MVRIHDAFDTATSGATEQAESGGQIAFDMHLDGVPLEQGQHEGAGPSAAVVSSDPEDRLDTVNQQPDMKLVVISNRVAPFAPDKPQTGGLAAGLEPVVERSGALWVGSSDTRGDGRTSPCRW